MERVLGLDKLKQVGADLLKGLDRRLWWKAAELVCVLDNVHQAIMRASKQVARVLQPLSDRVKRLEKQKDVVLCEGREGRVGV